MSARLSPYRITERWWPAAWRSDSGGNSAGQWAVELIILLALLNLVALATVGPQRLAAMSPNLYWIPVVLMACQHGTMAGVAAAISAAEIQWLSGPSAAVGSEDLYDYLYRAWREPILWLVTAVVIGGLRNQQAHKLEHLRVRLATADERLEVIASYARTLRSHCEMLERSVACSADRSIEAGLAALDDVAAASFEELDTALPRAMDLLVGRSSYLLLTQQEGRLMIAPELCRILPDAAELPRLQLMPEELAAELARSRKPLSIRDGDALGTLGGVALMAVPVLSPPGERLIGALLVQTMAPDRIHAETERNLQHLAHKLAVPLARARVVVSFQRDRNPLRLLQPAEDTAAPHEHGRAPGAIVQEARKSVPE
jgi:hypothetical protein